MNRLLRLFPRPWRERYGDEVTELLSASTRSWVADALDLTRAAAAAWADFLDEMLRARRILMRTLRATALGLVAVGMISVAWAASALRHGIAELPGHWWSTLAAAPLVAGLVLAVPAWRPRRRG